MAQSYIGDQSEYFQNASQTVENKSEIRTVFISGLPEDVKEREIHNLFRFFPGYEGCNLVENIKGEDNPTKQFCAFAVFSDRQAAVYALQMLKDLRFDPSSPQSMRVEFAKSNTKYSYLSTPGEFFVPEKKKGIPMEHNYYPKMAYPFINNFAVNPIYPLPQSLISLPPANLVSPRTSSGSQKQSSTLYVADFHPVVTERDLTRLFETQPGFSKLVMSKTGLPFCFVYYDDIQSATKAMQSFHGILVGPSHLRIEYAREKKKNQRKEETNDNNEVKST